MCFLALEWISLLVIFVCTQVSVSPARRSHQSDPIEGGLDIGVGGTLPVQVRAVTGDGAAVPGVPGS